jgi:rhodanese-related sulfurtransferase
MNHVSWIEPGSLADWLGRDPRPAILDVRGPDEFAGPLGHIPDALNLPVSELAARLTEIKALKERPIILVCRTDKRSANAATFLWDSGFRDVHVLRGGMEQWQRSSGRKTGQQSRPEGRMP